jgi:hypothetical protein
MFGGHSESELLLLDINSGAVVADINKDNILSAVANETGFFIKDSMGTVSKFDLNTGDVISEFHISSLQSSPSGSFEISDSLVGMTMLESSSSVIAIASDDGLYTMHKGSLIHAKPDGEIEIILENTMHSIGAPRTSVNAILPLPDGSIIIGLTNAQNKSQLLKFTWDENAVIDPNQTLTIWSLEDNPFVRAAITALRRTNPDVTIHYEIALDGDGAASASDAIRTLNTRLLSGDGPDVLILDNTPVESYAQRGMLLDLKTSVDISDIFENLVDPFIINDNLYFLPTQLFIPTLVGSADALSKVNSLDDLVSLVVAGNDSQDAFDRSAMMINAIPSEERPELHFGAINELHDVMWPSAVPAIISENRLNIDALRAYLEAIKAISDKYNLSTNQSESGLMSGMSVTFVAGSSSGDMVMFPASLTNYTMEKSNYAAFIASN